jgi:hypothetical protein
MAVENDDAAADAIFRVTAARENASFEEWCRKYGITSPSKKPSREVQLSRLKREITAAANPIFNTKSSRPKARKAALGSQAAEHSALVQIRRERAKLPPARRFWPRVEQPSTGCWTWHGPVDSLGAGIFEGRPVWLEAGGAHACPESGMCARPEHVR